MKLDILFNLLSKVALCGPVVRIRHITLPITNKGTHCRDDLGTAHIYILFTCTLSVQM